MGRSVSVPYFVPLVLCLEFWDLRILGVLENDGDTAARSRLLLIEVNVSCKYPGL